MLHLTMRYYLRFLKSASNANMYMFAILAGFLPAKTLVEGFPQASKIATCGDGCASCGR